MNLSRFLPNRISLSYATRIVLGCIITWWSLYYIHDTKKIWALISVIVISDPDFRNIRTAIISRIINTLTGCILGLLFIYLAGVTFWSLMAAIAMAVIISTTFKNYPSSWKLAPTTVVIVMMPAIVENAAWKDAMLIALARTGEVLYGSLVAFVLGFIFASLKKWYEKKYPHKAVGTVASSTTAEHTQE
jgi:uncharacterized membrane protein YccC